MITGNGDAQPTETLLVVVTTNPVDTDDVVAWLRPQLAARDVTVARGFYAGVAAIKGGCRAIVLDIGAPDGRDSWRLAELRHCGHDVSFVVLADATVLPQLSGALRTDLAVTSVHRLPPLRELLVTDQPLVDDQTIWRRTTR